MTPSTCSQSMGISRGQHARWRPTCPASVPGGGQHVKPACQASTPSGARWRPAQPANDQIPFRWQTAFMAALGAAACLAVRTCCLVASVSGRCTTVWALPLANWTVVGCATACTTTFSGSDGAQAGPVGGSIPLGSTSTKNCTCNQSTIHHTQTVSFGSTKLSAVLPNFGYVSTIWGLSKTRDENISTNCNLCDAHNDVQDEQHVLFICTRPHACDLRMKYVSLLSGHVLSLITPVSLGTPFLPASHNVHPNDMLCFFNQSNHTLYIFLYQLLILHEQASSQSIWLEAFIPVT